MPQKIFKHSSFDGKLFSSKWEIDGEIQLIVKLRQRSVNKTTVGLLLTYSGLSNNVIFLSKKCTALCETTLFES